MTVKNYCFGMQLLGMTEQLCLTDKPPEYGHHGPVILKDKALGMPLNTKNGSESGRFNALNDSVRCHCRNTEPLWGLLYRLMMERVHGKNLLTE